MREYQKSDNAKIFYDKLKNMKEKPIGDDIQNTYFLSLATAAYKNGEDQPKDTIIPSQIIDANNAEEAMTNGMAF